MPEKSRYPVEYLPCSRIAGWLERKCPKGKIYLAADVQDALAASGIDQCSKIFALCSTRSQCNRRGDRDVIPVETENDWLYLKRYLALRKKEIYPALLLPFAYRSLAYREWQNYRILERLGIATARPVAWGEKKTGMADYRIVYHHRQSFGDATKPISCQLSAASAASPGVAGDRRFGTTPAPSRFFLSRFERQAYLCPGRPDYRHSRCNQIDAIALVATQNNISAAIEQFLSESAGECSEFNRMPPFLQILRWRFANRPK